MLNYVMIYNETSDGGFFLPRDVAEKICAADIGYTMSDSVNVVIEDALKSEGMSFDEFKEAILSIPLQEAELCRCESAKPFWNYILNEMKGNRNEVCR